MKIGIALPAGIIIGLIVGIAVEPSYEAIKKSGIPEISVA